MGEPDSAGSPTDVMSGPMVIFSTNPDNLTSVFGLRAWWLNVSSTRSVIVVMAAAFAVHVVVSRVVALPEAGGRYELLLGVAYFVFGILVAFAIDNARSGLSRVNELLKASDADLVSIYQLSASFGPGVQSQVREVIDRHLHDQIDFRLTDFDKSTPSFLALFTCVRELEPTSTQQEIAYDHLLGICTVASERRKQLEALVRQRVSPVEWVTLLALLAALWGLMLAANGGPIISGVLGGVLVAALAGLLVLLRHLDDFRWQEGEAIWTPLHNLFLSLDLLPYYPLITVQSGRLDPPTGQVRLVDYPHPYTDMSDKTIEVVDHVRKRR